MTDSELPGTWRTQTERDAWRSLPEDAWKRHGDIPDDILRIRPSGDVYSLGYLVAEKEPTGLRTTTGFDVYWRKLYDWEWLSCKTGEWKPCRIVSTLPLIDQINMDVFMLEHGKAQAMAKIELDEDLKAFKSTELLPYQIEVNRLLDELEKRIDAAIGSVPQKWDEGSQLHKNDQKTHGDACTKIETIVTQLRTINEQSR